MPMQTTAHIHSHYPSPRNLRQSLDNMLDAEPTSRLYDIAEHFEISEVEPLATRCGDTVTRLEARCWSDLVGELPKLGCVTALTRNRYAVHKKTGTYRNARIMGNGTLVLDKEIALQLFLNHWQSGFAVVEEIMVGQHLTMRRSLQFFDHTGTVVHKVFLMEDSNHGAYETLVKHFTSDDQSPEQLVSLAPKPLRQPRDSDVDIKGLRAYWQALRDARDFDYMCEQFAVMPIQALRLAGNDLAWRAAPTGFHQLMEIIVARELPITVSVGSTGVIQTHTGLIHGVVAVGPWLSMHDADLKFYLREDRIHTAWVVKKPSADGMVTALELYDAKGENIATLSGKRNAGQVGAEAWRNALCALRPLDPALVMVC